MSHDTPVTVKKCAELTGWTENAIRALIKKGQLRLKVHYFRAPNGRIFIDLEAFNRWIRGTLV